MANLPWAHSVIPPEKCKEPEVRAWYAQAALHHGWSRNILAMQIDSKLRLRQGQSITNFCLSAADNLLRGYRRVGTSPSHGHSFFFGSGGEGKT